MYKYLWGKCKLKKNQFTEKELINKIVGQKLKKKKIKKRLGKKVTIYWMPVTHVCLFKKQQINEE